MQGLLAIIGRRIFCLLVCYPSIKMKIFRAVILAVVLYGCETWSLTLREARRLRMFQNRVLRKIFAPKPGSTLVSKRNNMGPKAPNAF